MRKITALILCLLMCFSLCSCRELDELRESQAFRSKNGTTYNGIIYKENLYKRVDTSDNLNYSYTNHKILNVTTPDVPVLLSTVLNLNYYVNENETIIVGGGGDWYVREDSYPLYEQSIKNGINYTDLGFEYYDEQLQENTDYILTEAEKDAVLSLTENNPVVRDVVQDMLYLYQQSDDGLFRRSDPYYIIRCPNGYYLSVDDTFYKSNEQTDKIFNSFFEKRYSRTNYDYSHN